MKKKISFYGNELLINSYNYLKDYPNANFYTKSSYKYDDLYKELELSMIEQEKNMKNKQEENERKIEEESANWDNIMNDFNKGEEELKKAIYKIPIVGVGDSVMLGATNKLYKMFPNGYFDAKVSRTDYEANKILIDMKNRGLLKDVVVIGLGTNGQCGEK